MLNRRLTAATMVVLTSMLAGQAVYAAPVAVHLPVHAVFSHSKTVSFSLRNDTKAPIKLLAGTTEMTLAPGKTVSVKLALGDKIVSEDSTPHYAAGAVVAVASAELSDSTVALN